MAYIPSECTLQEYENVIYSGDAKHRLYIKHGNTVVGTNGDNNASPFASKLTLKRRLMPNGSQTFSLDSFVSQEVEIVLHDYTIQDLTEDIEIKIGTYIDSVSGYVYVPLGIFKIQDNPQTDKGKTTYKLRDKSVNFDFNYNAKPLIDASYTSDENGNKYVTKLDLLLDICKEAKVEYSGSKIFIGYNDKIAIYDNSITARKYVSYLAEQAGCIAYMTRDGKLDFKEIRPTSLIERTINNEIVESFTNSDNYEISKILYESGVLNFANGSDEKDTLFINSSNPYITKQTDIDRLSSIIGFKINSFKTGKVLGNPTIDPFDLIKIEYDGIIYKTLGQYTLTFSGTMTSTYETNIKYEAKQINVSKNSDQTFKKEIKSTVDNVNALMNITAKTIDDQNKKITDVTIAVGELESKITEVAGLTSEKETFNATVEFADINESEPIAVKIRPIGESISNLLISSNMLIDDNFKLKQRVLDFYNKDTGKHIPYILPDDLLYYDENNYDEFNLNYGDGDATKTCTITKKCKYNEDGTISLLETPETINITPYPYIVLENGDYIVSLLGYSQAYISATLMVQNLYTTQFYTKAEVNSEINQTANTIREEVNGKFENYSTTTQMNNTITQLVTDTENRIKSEISNIYTTKEETTELTNTIEQIITDEVNSINLEVNKKANTSDVNNALSQKANTNDVNASLELKIDKNDNNQVVSMINASADIINFRGNRVTIDSDNFELTADGKITATAGDIGGFDLSETNFSSEVSGIYNFTTYDIKNCLAYLRKYIHNSSIQNYILDVNKDGTADILDLLNIYKMAIGEEIQTQSVNAEFKINAQDPKNCVSVICNGETTVSLGAGGINADVTNTKSLIVAAPDETKVAYNEVYGIFANGETAELLITNNNSSTTITPNIIRTPELIQTSKESVKKNFEKFKGGIEIIKDADVYSYNLKIEEDTDKKHIGLVINDLGGDYKTPKEVISKNNDGIDLYSMISISWEAIKEQQMIIEELKKEIEELKNEKENN